jgi:hypothetical protein
MSHYYRVLRRLDLSLPLNPEQPHVNAVELLADLHSYHIEGYAHEDPTRSRFDVPLFSHVTDTLYQGGCIQGANLKGFFKHIISLYPWERYNPGGDLDSFTEVRLYDGPVVPDEDQLYNLARWINQCRKHGNTLVHCQAGLNRSGLLTGLALVLDGMTPEGAIALLRAGRCPQVLCNPRFERWLREETHGA